MPSSFVDSYSPIVHLLIDIAPKRIVDIGPGWGKYGLACREYLIGLETLRAIEVAEGRLPTQDVIYDLVYTDDVRDLVSFSELWSRFDLALLIDVIEHMPKQDGHALLHALQGVGLQVLVSTPKVFVEQHDPDNPFERHQSLWGWEDFSAYGISRDVSTIDSIIYLLER